MRLDRLRAFHLFSLGCGRYLAATLFVAIALLLALALQPYTSQSPFLPFIAAVMVSAGVAGLRPALFATALSVLAADYFLVLPLGTLYVTAPHLIPMGLFVIEAVLISYFIEYLGIARRSAAKAEADVTGLYLHSSRLLEGKALGPMLEQTLAATMELMHSEKAVIHVFDRQHHAVQLMAQRGFPDSISERFQTVRAGGSACGAAAERRRRVVVEDIRQNAEFGHLASLFAEYGVVAVQSTPLFRQDGEVFGVLSTYTSQAYRPSTSTLNLLDLYLRQAERILEAKWQEELLRRSHQDLETAMHQMSRELLEKELRLRDLLSEVVLAEEQERNKLAAELHDYLAQMLVVARMKLQCGLDQTRASPPSQYFAETDDILQCLIAYTRTMMAELAPPNLEAENLPAALVWIAQQMPEHGLRVDLDVGAEQVPLPRETAVLLYRSIRELLINVAKHAGVDRATVSLRVEPPDMLTVVVADAGRGFDVETLHSKRAGKHFGAASIQERMALIGGSAEIKSAPGQGTMVTLTVPCLTDYPFTTRAGLSTRPAGS
jgi:signal transduction histidine kinase